jgi:hypothetical protein
MRDRRCFVQFIRSGSERRPDERDLKRWNRDDHRRKFLKLQGRYVADGELREGEIELWGEWEANSRVVKAHDASVSDPTFLYKPYFVRTRDSARR